MYWNNQYPNAHRIPIRRPAARRAIASATRQPAPVSPIEDAPRLGESLPMREIESPQLVQQPAPSTQDKVETIAADEVDWRAVAQRQQADMDNFRRRQTRRADEAIIAERERLLKHFLPVADNLNRALDHSDQEDATLREGVELVYRQLMSLFQAEGVTPIEAIGRPFDPELHEAVATASNNAEPGVIVDQIEAGYTLKDKLLRPARVVVAE